MQQADPYNLIRQHILSVADFSDADFDRFLGNCNTRIFHKNEFLLKQGSICKEIYFLNSGFLRSFIKDNEGAEHTIHFVKPGFYITEYASFLRVKPATYSIIAHEKSEVVVIPKPAVLDGYENIKDGNKLGRIIAEDIFIMVHDKVENKMVKTPLELYDELTEEYPGIHQKVPQHMIASLLGISPVHLSRLKSAKLKSLQKR